MVRDQTWSQTLCVEEMLEARYHHHQHDYDENGDDEKDEIGDNHDYNDDNTHDE